MKHNPEIVKTFNDNMKDCTKMKESDLLEKLAVTVRSLETDDSYNTNKKLKIYNLISQLSNCAENDRPKYVRRIAGLLK